MKSIYNCYIPEDLVRKMLDAGFPLYKYSIGGYDGKPIYYTKDFFDPDWIDCDAYKIPTYTEVLDMLLDGDIVISIEPTDESKFQYRVHLLKGGETFSGLSNSFKGAMDKALFIAINFWIKI